MPLNFLGTDQLHNGVNGDTQNTHTTIYHGVIILYLFFKLGSPQKWSSGELILVVQRTLWSV